MNCREYCQYKTICAKYYHNFKGEEKLDSSDCPMAWKIEDGLMDAQDIAEEQVPFTDPPEMTEEEWYEIEKQENEEE